NGGRKKPPSKDPGADRDAPSGITLPDIRRVYEPQWKDYSPQFNRFTSLRIRDTGADTTPDGKRAYRFYVNMDNLYLKSEIKSAGVEAEAVRNRFVYGNVLIGLALLHQEELDHTAKAKAAGAGDEEKKNAEVEETNIEDKIERVTTAIAPVLL